jgi:hypothetical protein
VSGVANACAIYYCINQAAGGANTVTFHQTGGGQQLVGLIEFTGQAATNPLDQFAVSQIAGTGSAQNLTPVGLTNTNEAVIAITMTASSFLMTFGGLYTVCNSVDNFRGGVGVAAEFGYFASGTQTPVATLTSGHTYMSFTISLNLLQPQPPSPSPAIGWSPVDSRVAVNGFGPGANTGIVDSQGNTIYSAQNPPFSGNSQVSDNTAIPPVDSRVSKPVDSRTNKPVNSRVAPPFGEAGEP